MTLPDFLGIGAQKAASSWLYYQLRSHPEVYMSTVKEIHFFDSYWDKGLEWYQSFFPKADKCAEYRAIGEITPKYIFDPQAPARIKAVLDRPRLIVILRNPIDRLLSQFRMSYSHGITGELDSYLLQDHSAIGRGYYAEQLTRYLGCFTEDLLLVLIYERIFGRHEGKQEALFAIAKHLGISPNGFKDAPLDDRPNKFRGRPRFPRFYSFAVWLAGRFARAGLASIPEFARSLGIRRLFGGVGPPPPLSAEDRRRLAATYSQDVSALRSLLNDDIPEWIHDFPLRALP